LTLIADVIGRSIRDQGRLREADTIFDFVEAVPEAPAARRGGGGGGGGGGGSGATPTGRSKHATQRQFRLEPGNLNLLSAAPG
jgi:hypothetical protein